MASPKVSASSILAKYKKTRGRDPYALIERLRLKEIMAREREEAAGQIIGQVGQLGISMAEVGQQYKLAKLGGHEGGLLDFFRNLEQSQRFIDLGRKKAIGGETSLAERMPMDIRRGKLGALPERIERSERETLGNVSPHLLLEALRNFRGK